MSFDIIAQNLWLRNENDRLMKNLASSNEGRNRDCSELINQINAITKERNDLLRRNITEPSSIKVLGLSVEQVQKLRDFYLTTTGKDPREL